MDLPQSEYKIRITGSGGLTFTNESRIYFENDNLHMFLQTDKTRYSAGQEGNCVMFSTILRSTTTVTEIRLVKPSIFELYSVKTYSVSPGRIWLSLKTV